MKIQLILASVLLAACSSLPPAIEDPPAYDLSYQQAITNINAYKNSPVRWGGIIVEVENEPAYSALQVLQYPLTSHGRPELDEDAANRGRFVIKSPSFLDPAVYKKNTPVTVAGNLEGDEERKIGNKPLRLPVVFAKNIQLWQMDSAYYSPYPYYYPYGGYGGYGYGFGFGSGFYPYSRFGYGGYGSYGSPFWGGGYYGRRW